MSNSRSIARIAVLSILIVVPVAEAQLNRTAVSIAGDDANDCSTATPCRSINRALSQTNTGGEVVVLDSAGYGPFTVTKAVTVEAAPGAYAGISAPAGDGVTVNLPVGSAAKAVLRGLTINGLGTGSAGILFSGGDAGTELHVESCVINGFVNWGILSFLPIRVQDTVIRNTQWGIQIDNAGAPVNATIENVQVKRFSSVAFVSWRNATVVVRDSIAEFGNIGFYARDGGILNVENGLSSENSTGVFSDGGTVRLSNTMIVNNTSGVVVGTGVVQTFGNNRIGGNGTNISGTLTSVAPM